MSRRVRERRWGEGELFGLIAEFGEADDLVAAAQKVRDAGFQVIDAYSPFPIPGLPDAIGLRPSRLRWLVLAGAIAGGFTGYFMQYYLAVVDYPWNIGGRPFHSWPAFIPITFEMTILGAASCAVFGMLIANGLPRPYHPVFNATGFDRASRDRFFLLIESGDPRFQIAQTRSFLESLRPLSVREVLT